ncbi:MAG: protein phosphatase CheZ [Alphaproteobacteria bacterium]|nr:protein phosphatase CheZ [Alphaproteobacteria bacterium]
MTEVSPKMQDQSYGRDQVVKIINSVLSRAEQPRTEQITAIYGELIELKRIIEEARAEIGATRANEISEKHIPTATDELDAVVAATADATGRIMDSCDLIEEGASSLGNETGEKISAEVIKIYEACSFQDITGQRIQKVVGTMRTIEDKVEKLVTALGTSGKGGQAGEEEDTRSPDEKLLNGPQLPGNAISQDDIDRILSEA